MIQVYLNFTRFNAFFVSEKKETKRKLVESNMSGRNEKSYRAVKDQNFVCCRSLVSPIPKKYLKVQSKVKTRMKVRMETQSQKHFSN